MHLFDIDIFNIYPRQLEALLGAGLERLPHAMLLAGPEGLGKSDFAQGLARLLLCESPVARAACGACQACRWIAGDNHPDLRQIKAELDDPSEEGAQEKTRKRGPGLIRIDQIRDLEAFVFVGSHRMGRRVVLVHGAEAMNNAAANSLLKILEEPPPSVYFLLITSRPRLLLPTVRSRCRTLTFSPPDAAAAANIMAKAGLSPAESRFLAISGGAPMRLIAWKETKLLKPLGALIESLQSPPGDPVALAAHWDGLLRTESSFTLEHLVEEVQRWLMDLALDRATGRRHYHAEWNRPGQKPETLNQAALLGAWQELKLFRKSSRHPLNQMLFLESVATHFLRALHPGRA